MRRIRRGMPVRCETAHGALYAVVYDRPLPRERERGLVYVRAVADHPLVRRGQRVHVPQACLSRRTPGAHALRARSGTSPDRRVPWRRW